MKKTPSQWLAEFPGLASIINRMVAADPRLVTGISQEKLDEALKSLAQRDRLVPQERAQRWNNVMRRVTSGNPRYSMPDDSAA